MAYLRNSLAYTSKPSLAEDVAGIAAMSEVLRDHGQEQAAQQMLLILGEVREASWQPAGWQQVSNQSHYYLLTLRSSTGNASELSSQLDVGSFGVLILEQAMGEFADTLGNELHSRCHPPHAAPSLPMEVTGRPSVCNFLRNGKVRDGHSSGLKHWVPYWGSSSTTRWDWSQAEGILDQIEGAKHNVNHKAEIPLDVARIIAVVQGMVLLYIGLQLNGAKLQALLTQLLQLGTQQSVSVIVKAENRGGMRIPFPDPRRYLVGRAPLISAVATQLCSQPSARVLLHGESGTGKTVAAIAAANEVRFCSSQCFR